MIIIVGFILLIIGILLLVTAIGMVVGVTCAEPISNVISGCLIIVSLISIFVGAFLTGTEILVWLGVL